MGRPEKHACPFECGTRWPTKYQAEMHANGAHRTPHPKGTIEHGTPRGYRMEQRHGIQTCQACRTAWADYMRPRQRTAVAR